MHNNSKSSTRLPFYLSIAVCIGIFIGVNMVKQGKTSNDLVKNHQKLKEILSYIENDYVDEVEADELVETAIKSMLEKLDPHSSYIPARDLEIVQSRLEGNYEGIGIEFNIFKDTIHVVTALSGGPSEKLGIVSGDKIIEVDGKNVASVNMTNDKVVRMLRGEGGTEVVVSILRKGEKELINFKIERDVIPQYSVDVSYMVDDNVGYIKISRFANSTYMEFMSALLELKDQGMTKLILDLSGNPGGYLNRAVEIVDEFIAGNELIVYTDGKEKRYTEKHFSSKDGEFESGKLVVMIDEGSASASEIVSGAIQDHDRGLIVGRRSFGKGLVQLPIDLSDGSEIRLTISRYYTPSGRSIQKPYSSNLDDYYQEAYNRYLTGEVYSADSIKVNDTLAYETESGRIVYGGGGITPDEFVPLDTTQNTAFLSRLFSSNSIQEYTSRFSQSHKEKLSEMKYASFLQEFEVTNEMLNELLNVAKSNNLKIDQIGFERSKPLVRTLCKAYIARGIWDNSGFYPIFNQQDEIYLRAVEAINQK